MIVTGMMPSNTTSKTVSQCGDGDCGWGWVAAGPAIPVMMPSLFCVCGVRWEVSNRTRRQLANNTSCGAITPGPLVVGGRYVEFLEKFVGWHGDGVGCRPRWCLGGWRSGARL